MNLETKKRTIVSALAAINTLLIMFDIRIFEGVTDEQIYTVVSAAVLIGTWVWGFYKNNDFSKTACIFTGLMRIAKAKNKDVSGENFFDEAEVEKVGE